jgi:NAD(P)-dependent dehydrogenase (short-subunit alcohol dehydrogenase family)
MQQPDAPLAVIIGGGNGIGEATCRLMRARGWRLVVCDRDGAAAAAVARAVSGTAMTLDIGDGEAIEAAAHAIDAAHDPVAALVVAAAVFQDVLPPSDLPVQVWDDVLRVNLTGTYLCARAFGTRMAQQGGGSIVNIASIAALGSFPVHAYAATKRAVVSLTEGLAGEWGRSGVRVNAVSPGSTIVPRIEKRLSSGRYADDPGTFTALGRMVMPLEVAETIEFLASDRASAITGQNIVVDCGWQAASTWSQYGGVRAPVAQTDVVRRSDAA